MYEKLLTKQEERVMELFWQSSIPLTSKDILAKLCDESWTGSYVYSVLRSLKKKEMIDECGLVPHKTQSMRAFFARVSKEEFYVRLAYANHVDVFEFLKLAILVAIKENPEEKMLVLQTITKMT